MVFRRKSDTFAFRNCEGVIYSRSERSFFEVWKGARVAEEARLESV